MEKVQYKDKVINMLDKTVVLDNVFAYYDEENEVYWVSDNLLIDDGETKVDANIRQKYIVVRALSFISINSLLSSSPSSEEGLIVSDIFIK